MSIVTAAERNAATISMGRGMNQSGAYVYIYRLLQRLCSDTGNHYQLPYMALPRSLTCPFAGGVTAGVHNEGVDILIPFAE